MYCEIKSKQHKSRGEGEVNQSGLGGGGGLFGVAIPVSYQWISRLLYVSCTIFALVGCETFVSDRIQRVEAEECARILVIYETQRQDSKVKPPPIVNN